MILPTIDHDFLNRQQYPPPHAGIVVVRLGNARTFRQDVVAGILILADRMAEVTNTIQMIESGSIVRQVAPS